MKYRVTQGSLQVTFNLDDDCQQPLLTVLGAFFYHHRRKAVLKPPEVYQGKYQVLPEQIEQELGKLKIFFVEKEIFR